MNRIDSLKLITDTNLISRNAVCFEKTIKETESGIKTSYSLKKHCKEFGIKNIIINEKNSIIEISSKLIPELYKEMISINTIIDYMSNLKKKKIIDYDKYSVIENSEVLSCDITNNYNCSNAKEYLNSLAIYKLNNKYKCNYHYNESLIFERDVKTNSLKERLTIYCKYPELSLKRNERFRKLINIEDYKNILRFESRFSNFELIRNSFKVKDLKLLNILETEEKINYNLFNKITKIENKELQTYKNYNALIEMKKKYKHSKIRNIQGDLSILRCCNYDIGLIKLYFKTNSNSNNSKYIKHYKELAKCIKESENENDIENKVIKIKEFLKLVA